MAQKKAHEVDRYLAKPDSNHRTFLIYGPDIGLVSERAKKLAKSSGADLDDPFSTIVIDADEAAADPSRIADEAHTVSMFGGDRIVWIKGSTQKNLAGAIQSVLDLPPSDAIIIVEAGDLKKTSPLRKRIEKAPSAVALPCYQDQAQAIDMVINEEMKANNLTIDNQAKSLLKSLLGGDRLASRGEVQKLCLYASGNGQVTIEDIQAIVGDASALAVDTVIDAASVGDIPTMEHTFKRLIAQGTAVFQLINAAQRHFQTLHQARAQMDANRQPASSVIGTMRPPVNFQRKDKVTRALSLWQAPALERALARLEKTSLETRANAALAVPLASTALLAIAIEAKHNGR
ncbi:MAG: DNA polymerase III subunit delta [Rhizobiaceae bacterium]